MTSTVYADNRNGPVTTFVASSPRLVRLLVDGVVEVTDDAGIVHYLVPQPGGKTEHVSGAKNAAWLAARYGVTG